MFVCIFTDENGFDNFGQGETLDAAFESSGHGNIDDIAFELKNGGLRFFEEIPVQYEYIPVFTKA